MNTCEPPASCAPAAGPHATFRRLLPAAASQLRGFSRTGISDGSLMRACEHEIISRYDKLIFRRDVDTSDRLIHLVDCRYLDSPREAVE